VRVPEDLSIVGFDDLPIASMTTPRLCTMRVNREAIGAGAIRLLLRHIEGDTAIHQLEIGVSSVEGGTIQSIVA
jgi:DNA-binding LacI/PurR family transcriptional regulator